MTRTVEKTSWIIDMAALSSFLTWCHCLRRRRANGSETSSRPGPSTAATKASFQLMVRITLIITSSATMPAVMGISPSSTTPGITAVSNRMRNVESDGPLAIVVGQGQPLHVGEQPAAEPQHQAFVGAGLQHLLVVLQSLGEDGSGEQQPHRDPESAVFAQVAGDGLEEPWQLTLAVVAVHSEAHAKRRHEHQWRRQQAEHQDGGELSPMGILLP